MRVSVIPVEVGGRQATASLTWAADPRNTITFLGLRDYERPVRTAFTSVLVGTRGRDWRFRASPSHPARQGGRGAWFCCPILLDRIFSYEWAGLPVRARSGAGMGLYRWRRRAGAIRQVRFHVRLVPGRDTRVTALAIWQIPGGMGTRGADRRPACAWGRTSRFHRAHQSAEAALGVADGTCGLESPFFLGTAHGWAPRDQGMGRRPNDPVNLRRMGSFQSPEWDAAGPTRVCTLG